MPIEQALQKDHPALTAFEVYKRSDDFRNSFKWAADVEHRVGSMWAAFWEGYQAALRKPSVMEQIARDMRDGTFPRKSEATLREEGAGG
jgi:hypothetical protein